MARLTLLLFMVASMIFLSQAGTVQKRSLPDLQDLAEMFEEGEDVDKDQLEEIDSAEDAAPAEMPEEGEDVDETAPEETDGAEDAGPAEIPEEGENVGQVEREESDGVEDAQRPSVMPTKGPGPRSRLWYRCPYLCYSCRYLCHFGYRCHHICTRCRRVCFYG